MSIKCVLKLAVLDPLNYTIIQLNYTSVLYEGTGATSVRYIMSVLLFNFGLS